jgi:single-stranded DNA-binding protein
LGQDVELKYVKGGELPMVALFGEQAEELVHRLTKGTKVYCEGRLTLTTWQGKDGQQHTGLNVSARLVQPLGQIGKSKPKKPRVQKKPGAMIRRPPPTSGLTALFGHSLKSVGENEGAALINDLGCGRVELLFKIKSSLTDVTVSLC